MFFVHTTGFGKSSCFALIPKVIDRLKAFFEMVSLRPSIFLVVSPILRLMQDQVGRFCAMGICNSVAIRKSPDPFRGSCAISHIDFTCDYHEVLCNQHPRMIQEKCK